MTHDSKEEGRKYGTPADEFVKKGQQENAMKLVSEAIWAANDMIQHTRENYGAKVELSIRPEGLIDALVSFPVTYTKPEAV